jgi:hypothetical protein
LVTAPLQFCSDCCFAGAGNTLNEIIFLAHRSPLNEYLVQGGSHVN